jgi:hypothetical protein
MWHFGLLDVILIAMFFGWRPFYYRSPEPYEPHTPQPPAKPKPLWLKLLDAAPVLFVIGIVIAKVVMNLGS